MLYRNQAFIISKRIERVRETSISRLVRNKPLPSSICTKVVPTKEAGVTFLLRLRETISITYDFIPWGITPPRNERSEMWRQMRIPREVR